MTTLAVHEITDLNYERALRGYARTGDDLLLHVDLTALGFDREEIEWHLNNPGQRIRQGVALPQPPLPVRLPRRCAL